jgi:protein-S-isoprenylcysteine O-methyltransferase Ste14
MSPRDAVVGLWILWVVSWVAASAWSNRTVKRAGLLSEIRYRIPMMLGVTLMIIPAHGYDGPLRLWRVGWIGAWTCVLGIALGIAFAWWARLHLGRLWSGPITRKADHHIVDTGPYARVRHPIYTGMLFALLATAVVKGTLLAIGGFTLLLLGIWMKARNEEAWLSAELGAEAYADYRRRVPMLVPFWPTGG